MRGADQDDTHAHANSSRFSVPFDTGVNVLESSALAGELLGVDFPEDYARMKRFEAQIHAQHVW